MPTQYSLEGYEFNLKRFFPDYIFEKITDIRVEAPELILQQAKTRKRRPRVARNGRLSLLAADHPARGVTELGDDPFKMGDRQAYLGRILRVLIASEFDGFMSTSDMIEDLLIIDYLVQQGGGPSFLDDKVLVGCMQRGGVAGYEGEIDDRFGSYTAESIHRFNLDGGKMLIRFVKDNPGTLKTVAHASQAVTDLNRYGLIPFVEPLRMDFVNGKWVNKNNADELVKLVGVCGGLGDSTHNTWLKVPYCHDFHRVTMATTLPMLMLGGPSKEDPRDTYQDFAAAMSTRANVRGAMVGRNVSFPGPEDPAAAAQAIHQIIHQNLDPDEAVAITMAHRDTAIDFLTTHIGNDR